MADLRTSYKAGEQDHLEVHAALATEYNRTTKNPWTGQGSGAAAHLNAASFGLGASTDTSTDAAALTAFFAAVPLAFTETGLVRGGVGTLGELPEGTWYANQFGHVVLAPSGAGGDVAIIGQVGGGTTITALDRSPGTTNKWNGAKRGCMGTAAVMTSCTRGGTDAAGYSNPGNVFTLQLAAPWWSVVPTRATPACHQFDPIYLQVKSCGVLRWARFTCTMNNVAGDYTKVQYQAYAPGMAVDGCIPPAQTVYFPSSILHPIGFKGSQGHHIFFRHLTFAGGSTTGTPLDGIGPRWSSNSDFDRTVSITGFFDGLILDGSPWPLASTGNVGQNTDHNKCKAKFLNNDHHVAMLSNSGGSYIASLPVIGTGADAGVAGTVGGGRDNNLDESNFGSCTYRHITVADDGSIETGNLDKCNFKSGWTVVYGEGVRGVQTKEVNGIDGLEGWFKVESVGNWVFDDESKTRTLWSFLAPKNRFEAGIAINGSGNPTNFTDQPYFLQNVTMASSVMTAKIVTAFGGSTGLVGSGLGPGDAIQVGNAGPSYTLDPTMIGLGSNQATYTVVEDISAAPNSGSFIVQATFGQQTITYTNKSGSHQFTGCTGGAARNVLQHATGTNAQTGQPNMDLNLNVFNWETVISAVASDGFTITAPMPQYAGADGGGAGTTATCGTIGYMRAGTFGRFDLTVDWDLAGVDRYVQGGMFFDVNSLISGVFRVNRNWLAAGARKKLPSFRVRDAETISSTHGKLIASYTDPTGGTVYTNVLEDVTQEFNATDVGAKVICTGHLNGGGNNDTITAFIDVNHVQFGNTVTAGTGLTWNMRITKTLDDFGVRVELGNQSYAVEAHAASVANPDANAIAAGSLVEAAPTDVGNLGIICSVCSPAKKLIGMAVQPSSVDGTVGVTTSGSGNTAIFTRVTPSPLVQLGGAVNASDLVQLIGSAAIAVGYIIDDGATNPGQVKAAALTGGVPNAGQRIVGQIAKATGSAGSVAGRLFAERWT